LSRISDLCGFATADVRGASALRQAHKTWLRPLGKKHEFPTLSADILERYVCSGMPSTGTEHKGMYSDVVKAADLYFNASDFGFPTTIIDTPGTNDPFLVRDEITRRTLENADIYVVLLTARQALSSADVALLRILRGLHKDRLAVFINRIDELADVVADITPIVQHVRDGLHREFPGAEIPIVVGSALWAEVASSGSQADIDHVLSAKVTAYAHHLAAQASSPTPDSARMEWKEEGAPGLFQCSGLPALIDVIARLTPDSHVGRVQAQILRSFSELGRLGQNAAQHELAVLEAEAQSAISNEADGEDELRAIDGETQENERLIVALQTVLSDLQQSTDRLIDDHSSRMADVLSHVVQGFAEEECENMHEALAQGHRGRVWRCDPALLRQQLEERFVAAYREAAQEMDKLESHIFPKLKQLLNRYHPQWRSAGGGNRESAAAELPLLNALSEVVALDLDQPWWRYWWTGQRSAEARVAELDHLIRDEFEPVVEALVQAARGHLKSRQSLTLQEGNLVYVGLAELLKEQNEARLERMRTLIAGGNLSRRSELQRNHDARIADLKKQISSMDLVVRRLENVEQMWAAKLG
jgi:hypothetical protein